MKIPENQVPCPKRDNVGYGRNVPKVVWPGEARVAINIVFNFEEGSEVYIAADGQNEGELGEIPCVMDAKYRDLPIESLHEYGSRAGI